MPPPLPRANAEPQALPSRPPGSVEPVHAVDWVSVCPKPYTDRRRGAIVTGRRRPTVASGLTPGHFGGQLRPRPEPELVEDVAHMRRHGAPGDEETARDLGVRQTGGDQPDDVRLRRRQAVPPGGRPLPLAPAPRRVRNRLV